MGDEVADFLTLDAFAEITARVDAGQPKDGVLREKGVTLELFEREQRRWLSDISMQVARQRYDLQRRFSDAYARYRLAIEPALTAARAPEVEMRTAAAASAEPAFMPKPIVLPPVDPPPPVTSSAVAAPPFAAPPFAAPSAVAAPPFAAPPLSAPAEPPSAGSQGFRPVAPPPAVSAALGQAPPPAPPAAVSPGFPAQQAHLPPHAAPAFAHQAGQRPNLNSTSAFRIMPGGFGDAFRTMQVTPPQAAPAQAAPAPPPASPAAPAPAAPHVMPSLAQAFPPVQSAVPAPAFQPQASPHVANAPPAPVASPASSGAPPQVFFVSAATLAGQSSPVAPQGAPAPAAPTLSLEQHACLSAELELQPERAAQIYQAYSLDAASYQAEVLRMNERLSADPSLVERFRQLCQYYRAIMAPRS
jgi:hypothetical protein